MSPEVNVPTGVQRRRFLALLGPSPPGFEGYFREISVPPGEKPRRRSADEIEALNRRYHIRYR
jgi:hypothetical protein